MSENIITKPFRLAFPEVFKPRASKDSDREVYSVNMLFPADGSLLIPSMKGDPIMDLRLLALKAIKATWGDDKAKWPPKLKAADLKTHVSMGGDGWPIRDGDAVEWDGFAGMVFARASSSFRPGLVDKDLQPIIDQSAIWGGLICRAQVHAYAYENSGNKGVTFGLSNVQVLKDDDVRFGSNMDAAAVFGSLGDEFGGGNAFGSDDAEEDPFA